MSLSGTVIQIRNELVEVKVVPRPECQGCKTCQSLIGDAHLKEKVVQARCGGFALEPGDRVTLDLLPGMGSLAALIIFVIPLAGFFAGIWAGPLLAVHFGYAGGESAAFLCGIIGFFAAMGLIGLCHRLGWFRNLQLQVIARDA